MRYLLCIVFFCCFSHVMSAAENKTNSVPLSSKYVEIVLRNGRSYEGFYNKRTGKILVQRGSMSMSVAIKKHEIKTITRKDPPPPEPSDTTTEEPPITTKASPEKTNEQLLTKKIAALKKDIAQLSHSLTIAQEKKIRETEEASELETQIHKRKEEISTHTRHKENAEKDYKKVQDTIKEYLRNGRHISSGTYERRKNYDKARRVAAAAIQKCNTALNLDKRRLHYAQNNITRADKDIARLNLEIQEQHKKLHDLLPGSDPLAAHTKTVTAPSDSTEENTVPQTDGIDLFAQTKELKQVNSIVSINKGRIYVSNEALLSHIEDDLWELSMTLRNPTDQEITLTCLFNATLSAENNPLIEPLTRPHQSSVSFSADSVISLYHSISIPGSSEQRIPTGVLSITE